MSALVRCPQCDSFVKPVSIETGSCPFCPAASERNSRNPIPGMVLAATLAAAPACSGSTPEPEVAPVYGVSIEEVEKDNEKAEHDAGVSENSDASAAEVRDIPVPVYGGPPDLDKPVYGGPPDLNIDKPSQIPVPPDTK